MRQFLDLVFGSNMGISLYEETDKRERVERFEKCGQSVRDGCNVMDSETKVYLLKSIIPGVQTPDWDISELFN